MKRINVFLNQRRLNIVLVSLCNTKFTKITIKGDCKPTFICDEFISQFTRHELVCSNLFSRSRCRLPRKEYKKTFENWFNAKKILEEKALMNLSKMCQLKVDLH